MSSLFVFVMELRCFYSFVFFYAVVVVFGFGIIGGGSAVDFHRLRRIRKFENVREDRQSFM